MKLRELAIHRLPGIAQGFTLSELAPGINVVTGPNASGKSSLVRALRAIVDPSSEAHGQVHVEASFADADGTLRATRLGAQVHWTRAGERIAAPPLPNTQLLSCYTLGIEDLLATDHPADAFIAERLARELAGGYDVRAVREQPPFSLKRGHGRQQAEKVREARQALQRCEQQQAALQADEQRLTQLRQQLTAADAAARDAEAHRLALELLAARRERVELETQLANYPPAMQHLQGDERARLASVVSDREEVLQQREQAVRARTAALQALEASGLARVDLAESDLRDWQRLLERLHTYESDAQQQEKALRAAQQECDAATEALGGVAGAAVHIDPKTVAEVEAVLAEKRVVEARLAANETRLQGLPERPPAIEPMRQARQALLAWLAAPRRSALRASQGLAMVFGLLAALVGIAVAALGVAWGFLLLVVPLGWGIHTLWRATPDPAAQRGAETQLRRSGLAGPQQWTREAVEARLGELDAELQQGERALAAHEHRSALVRQVDSDRATLQALGQRLNAVADAVGFAPERLDASFERWLRLSSVYDQAQRTLRTAQAELEHTRREHARGHAELMTCLQRYGEAPATADVDAALLRQRLEHLATRLRTRDQARARLREMDANLDALDARCARLEQRLTEIFANAGIAEHDWAALDAHLARLAEWRQLHESLREARATEHARKQAIADRTDLHALVEADAVEELRSAHARYAEQAERTTEMQQTIARIEAALEQAGTARQLEQARSQHQIAEDALHARLQEAWFAEAGQLLLEDVAAEHEQVSKPAALQRAMEWFARFTQHQFTLLFEAQSDVFAARETASGQVRSLAELSSGTRAQLLLAVRMAFAMEAEHRTVALPLVLDEALSTADPERFGAVAAALRVLADADDRQIIYLTAQPQDVGYWDNAGVDAHCIDMARLRHQQRRVAEPRALRLPEPATPPAPGAHTPEAYAVALGVGPADPWAHVGTIHVFHLLRDELELVYRLVKTGIEHVGGARALLDTQASGNLLADGERHLLERRLQGAERWLEAWRQGRGRPVDRHALVQSDAVSETFIEQVDALRAELGGDGRALIHQLEAGAVRRFHASKRERLENWLIERGHIDQRERLSELDIELRVADALRLHVSDADAALAEARLLARSLATAVQAGVESGSSTDVNPHHGQATTGARPA